jgi:uncharacterized protein
MFIKTILGDYDKFFATVIENLKALNVDVTGLPMSHLGFKAKTVEEYESVREALLPYSVSMVENVHNGRPIAKIILRNPLQLGIGFNVSLMEIMPPKNLQAQIDGLEHCGFVVGNKLDDFVAKHKNVITGIQDQGPFCQPAFIVFEDGRRVKFYKYPLQQVVELEGHEFVPLDN